MLSIRVETRLDPPYAFGGFSWNAYVDGVVNNQQKFVLLASKHGSVQFSEFNFRNGPPISTEHLNAFGDRGCRHDKSEGWISISAIQNDGDYSGVGGLRYPKFRYISGEDKSTWYPLDISQFYDISWGDESEQRYGRIISYPAVPMEYYSIEYYFVPIYRRVTTSQWQLSGFCIQYTEDGTPFRWGTASISKTMYGSPIWPNDEALRYISPNLKSNFTSQASRLGVSSVQLDPDKFAPHIFESLLSSEPGFHPDLQDTYGDLADRIVSSASFPQVNLPAYFRDLFKTGEDVLKLARSVAKADIKSLSDAYLSYKYGMTLTVKDTLELARGLIDRATNLNWQSRKSMKHDLQSWRFGNIQAQYAYKVYYSLTNQDSSDLIDDLFTTDILGLGNTWDLIPFSFVADWFVGIGDFLESLDNTVLYNRLPVLSTVASVKLIADITDPQFLGLIVGPTSGSISGSIRVTVYSRTILPKLITPKLQWEKPSDFNHFLEAGALVVSTRYRR